MYEKEYKNLIQLLKLFKNRPYHLAKYLLENSALSQVFLDKLSRNSSLNELSEHGEKNPPILFTDITKMNDYFNSLIDIKSIEGKSIEELTIILNEQLQEYIKNEKYEDAANLRDYMFSKGIKRKK